MTNPYLTQSIARLLLLAQFFAGCSQFPPLGVVQKSSSLVPATWHPAFMQPTQLAIPTRTPTTIHPSLPAVFLGQVNLPVTGDIFQQTPIQIFKQGTTYFGQCSTSPSTPSKKLALIFERGFTPEQIQYAGAQWQKKHIHLYPAPDGTHLPGFIYIGHQPLAHCLRTREGYRVQFTALLDQHPGSLSAVVSGRLNDSFFTCPLQLPPKVKLPQLLSHPNHYALSLTSLTHNPSQAVIRIQAMKPKHGSPLGKRLKRSPQPIFPLAPKKPTKSRKRHPAVADHFSNPFLHKNHPTPWLSHPSLEAPHRKNRNKRAHIDDLPPEMVSRLYTYLSKADRLNLAATTHFNRDILGADPLLRPNTRWLKGPHDVRALFALRENPRGSLQFNILKIAHEVGGPSSLQGLEEILDVLLKHNTPYHALDLDLRYSTRGMHADSMLTLLQQRAPQLAIRHLNLSYCNLQDADIQKLVSILRDGGIQHLDLSGSRLKDAGLVMLAEALPMIPQLHTLDLSSNGITHIGMKKLSLSLPYTGIRKLNLSINRLDEAAIQSLADALPATQLQDLDLFLNDFGEAGAKTLIPLLSESKLVHLNLGYNGIGNVVIEELAKVLPKTQLESLNLSVNSIEDVGAGYLAKAIPNSHLKKINLGQNEMGEEGVRLLVQSISNSHLEELQVARPTTQMQKTINEALLQRNNGQSNPHPSLQAGCGNLARLKKSASSFCIDAEQDLPLTDQEEQKIYTLLEKQTSGFSPTEQLHNINQLHTWSQLIQDGNALSADQMTHLHTLIQGIDEHALLSMDVETQRILLPMRETFDQGGHTALERYMQQPHVAQNIGKVAEQAGLAFSLFLVGKHLAYGNLSELGYDGLNLYALPKLGQKITAHINSVAKSLDSTLLKGTAPLLGRAVGNLGAFLGLYDAFEARKASEGIDRTRANLNIATNAIFIGADVPAMATETASMLGLEVGLMGELAGPAGMAIGVATIVAAQLIDAGLQLKKMAKTISLTEQEKARLYWDFFFDCEMPKTIKQDLKAQEMYRAYISSIMEAYGTSYEAFVISEPKKVIRKYISKYCRDKLMTQFYLDRPPKYYFQLFCTSRDQTKSISFFPPYKTQGMRLDHLGATSVNSFPLSISPLTLDPWTRSDAISFPLSRIVPQQIQDYQLHQIPQMDDPNNVMTKIVHRTQKRSFDDLGRHTIKTLTKEKIFLSDDKRIPGFFVYQKNNTANYFSPNTLFYVHSQVSHINYVGNLGNTTLFFSGNRKFVFKDQTLDPNRINRYYFSHPVQRCLIEQQGTNYFYTKGRYFRCHLGKASNQTNILVTQGNFTDAPTEGSVHSLLGSPGKNHLTSIYPKYIDGLGGGDDILTVRGLVKGYPGDRITGRGGVVLLPFTLDELVQINITSPSDAPRPQDYLIQGRGGTLQVAQGMYMQTKDGFFIYPKHPKLGSIHKLQAIKHLPTSVELTDEFASLEQIKHPNFSIDKQLVAPNMDIVMMNRGNTVFHANQPNHTYYWASPNNKPNLYLMEDQPARITIKNGNGILDFIGLGNQSLDMRLTDHGDLLFSTNDLHLRLLKGFQPIKLALGKEGVYCDVKIRPQPPAVEDFLHVSPEMPCPSGNGGGLSV